MYSPQPFKLLGKTTKSQKDPSSANSQFIKDVYGERIGPTWEYWLAESLNEDEFLSKLKSLKDKW